MLNPFLESGVVKVPKVFNIGRACTQALGATGPIDLDKTALMVHRRNGQGDQISELSYRELDEQSNRFANALLAQGCVAGDRILLWLPNCQEFPIAFFACLKVGLIAVPASVLLAAEELEYLSRDSGARALVTNAALWERLMQRTPAQHGLEQVILVDQDAKLAVNLMRHLVQGFTQLQEPGQFRNAPEHETLANDPAYLVYTSGTTGYPKRRSARAPGTNRSHTRSI